MNIYHSNKISVVLLIIILAFTVTNAFAVSDDIHPPTAQLQSDYLLSDTLLTISDTLVISRIVINNEATPLTSFYFHENLPNDLSIISHTITVNNSVVSYDYPTPIVSPEYTNYTAYYWILDYPGTHGTYDLHIQPDDTVEIEYLVTSANVGAFDLPMHNFIGHNGSTGVFGLSDSLSVRFSIALDIEDDQNLPQDFTLSQNYPNPFNPSTTINFSIPEKSYVSIDIFNVLGQSVNSLVQQNLPAGNHQIIWNGLTNNGKSAPTGIYFYKLLTKDREITKKMLLLK